MKKLLLLLLMFFSPAVVGSIPEPKLNTFYDHKEAVFGMWWVSQGAEYDYILEVNELDGSGWFVVAMWIAPAKNSAMSGYTFIVWGNEAIARVRVKRTELNDAQPRGVSKWKIFKPVEF